ncbi:MAG: hypothetical protein Q7J16_03100 [Candidatus Cloacimonadales bacterium]|nr:hypothetical protein [Candidatus Cloacimonadales bacterium]
MRKLILTLLSAGVLCCVFSSCTIKYLPVASSDISITDDFAVIKAKDITFAIENQYWIKEPQNLTDYFTTFYVSIKNNTDHYIDVDIDDIIMLDEQDNQYNIVGIDYIETMLLPKQIEYLVINTIEESDDQKLDAQQFLENQKDALEKWREAKTNLITYSLSFGTIYPGAKRSGFIFFPRLLSKNNKCKILFRDKTIEFIRSDVKKKEEK